MSSADDWLGIWSPFSFSASGRPLLTATEVELLLAQEINVYRNDDKHWQHVHALLTSHRLFIYAHPQHDAHIGLAYSIQLQQIAEHSVVTALFKNAKLVLQVKQPARISHNLTPTIVAAINATAHSTSTAAVVPSYRVQLSFHDVSIHSFISKLKEALQFAQWEKDAQANSLQTMASAAAQTKALAKDFTTTGAGISGIIRTAQDKKMEEDRTIDKAFADLNALMKFAEDVVKLAERYKNKLEADLSSSVSPSPSSSSSSVSSSPSSTSSDNDAKEFSALLLSMGLQSPVTKDSAGSAFHEQLSRQLCDFLLRLFSSSTRSLSSILLPDLYSLYNRARGTELISPEDLYSAVKLFDRLGLPFRVRKFEESGVLVVESIEFSDSAMAKRIVEFLEQNEKKNPSTKKIIYPFVSVFSLAQTFNISMPLAKQHLTQAEHLGFLCRDDTYDGIRFYKNRFN